MTEDPKDRLGCRRWASVSADKNGERSNRNPMHQQILCGYSRSRTVFRRGAGICFRCASRFGLKRGIYDFGDRASKAGMQSWTRAPEGIYPDLTSGLFQRPSLTATIALS